MWWAGNQSITLRAVRRALCRLPQARRRHDAVRAGPLWRRRSDFSDQDPRLHRTCLALAVHPHAADPSRGVGARELRARTHHHRPAELPRRSQTSRRAFGERRRDRFRPQDRPDRRVLLCRRDEEVGLHHAELLSARQGRDADALLGQCRPRRRHRDLLRPVRHRQDHAVGRSQAHADRRRRARLGPGRRLQFRRRLLRQVHQAVEGSRARDLCRQQALRRGAGKRRARRRHPRARFRRRLEDREHPLGLSARIHPQRLAHRPRAAIRRTW